MVGLALLCRPAAAGEREVKHVGILFKDREKREIRLLHLAFHHLLVEGTPEPRYGWTALPSSSLVPEKARVLARLCGLLGGKYRRGSPSQLAYAFRYRGGKFDPASGDFLSQGGHGLTCATFILAVFASHGIHLLDCEQWTSRPGDAEWQAEMLRTLRETRPPVDPRHLQAIEAEIPCARFRPEEVAAAGLAGTLPMGFQDAERVGLALVQALFNHARP